jgi:hypothetical protein
MDSLPLMLCELDAHRADGAEHVGHWKNARRTEWSNGTADSLLSRRPCRAIRLSHTSEPAAEIPLDKGHVKRNCMIVSIQAYDVAAQC